MSDYSKANIAKNILNVSCKQKSMLRQSDRVFYFRYHIFCVCSLFMYISILKIHVYSEAYHKQQRNLWEVLETFKIACMPNR